MNINVTLTIEVRKAFSPSHTSADYFSVEMCDYDGKMVCKVCVLRPFPELTRLDGEFMSDKARRTYDWKANS